MAQIDSALDLEQISRFFERKVSRYIFLVIDDERVLKNLIAEIQSRLGKKKKKIRTLELNEENPSVYFQVKAFVDKNRCDGLIITGLNALIYKYSHDTLHLLNKSRDGFEDFSLPTAFVVNKANLKKIINGASDFYQLRDLPDFHFEGLEPGITNRNFLSISVPQPYDFKDSFLKIQLLEEQLEKAEKDKRVYEDILRNIVIPLFDIYIFRSDYTKIEMLYSRYIKGRESKIEDIIGAHQMGMIYEMLGRYDDALTQYGKDLEIAKRNKDIRTIPANLHQIGNIYYLKGRYDDALKQYEKVLEISEEIGNTRMISISLHQIGLIYEEKGLYDDALTQYGKSLEMAKNIGDTQGISGSLHQIGNIYYRRGRFNDALTQYKKALEIAEKTGDTQGISKSLHQIGIIYEEKGRYDDALKQYEKASKIARKIGDIHSVASNIAQKGRAFIKKQEYGKALKLYLQSYSIFSKLQSPNVEIVKKNIERIREKMSEDKFNKILKEFDLTIENLGLENADSQK